MAVKMNMQTVKKESRNGIDFLILPDGRQLAYTLTPGSLPGVVFMGGFHSDMTGAKAMAMETYCKSLGKRFLRFDYSGHGQSARKFEDCTIGDWKADALAMLDHIATGENIIIGSSMGGWIMLLAALARPEKVRGLLGISSAPDFVENLIWKAMDPGQQAQLVNTGSFDIPSCYGQPPYPITRNLVEEARTHLLLEAQIPLTMPVRLVHGLKDEDVPWHTAVTLAEKLQSADVRLTLIKDGNHRLSEPAQIQTITENLDQLLKAET